MPTYTYACDSCKQEFELEQKISEDPIKECKFCGQAVKRIIVPGSTFQLKGGGWFNQGYNKEK